MQYSEGGGRGGDASLQNLREGIIFTSSSLSFFKISWDSSAQNHTGVMFSRWACVSLSQFIILVQQLLFLLIQPIMVMLGTSFWSHYATLQSLNMPWTYESVCINTCVFVCVCVYIKYVCSFVCVCVCVRNNCMCIFVCVCVCV